MLGAKAVARAKINLFLDVGSLRDDGYHEVRSVMQSLELADELFFRRTDGSGGPVVLRCNDETVPVDESNLVWKAIEVFTRAAGIDPGGGIEVFLHKRIPVGAGLAGGSADAAATLVAMDRMFELELPAEALHEMSLEIGSDVPFCLVGGTAMVTGRGENVEPLEPLPSFKVVLATSGEEASTGDVYRRYDELSGGSELFGEDDLEEKLNAVLKGVKSGRLEDVCAGLHNSLEAAAEDREQVERYKSAALEAGAGGALMTGSGPTVFAPVPSFEEASGVAWELGKIAPVTIITDFSRWGSRISD